MPQEASKTPSDGSKTPQEAFQRPPRASKIDFSSQHGPPKPQKTFNIYRKNYSTGEPHISFLFFYFLKRQAHKIEKLMRIHGATISLKTVHKRCLECQGVRRTERRARISCESIGRVRYLPTLLRKH